MKQISMRTAARNKPKGRASQEFLTEMDGIAVRTARVRFAPYPKSGDGQRLRRCIATGSPGVAG